MKELLNQLGEYHVWATKKLSGVILSLPAEMHHQEIKGSFSSLFNLILHTWDAESIWWQRMKMEERVVIPGATFKGSMEEALNSLIHQSELWREWTSKASDLSLEHVFHYYNKKKELNKVLVSQLLVHVFNHGTYHRGQLVNALRQLGITNIPPTDYIVWVKGKK